MDESYLEWLIGLPGLGEAKARRLAERFPSLGQLRAATREELSAVKGKAIRERNLADGQRQTETPSAQTPSNRTPLTQVPSTQAFFSSLPFRVCR